MLKPRLKKLYNQRIDYCIWIFTIFLDDTTLPQEALYELVGQLFVFLNPI